MFMMFRLPRKHRITIYADNLRLSIIGVVNILPLLKLDLIEYERYPSGQDTYS